MTIQRYIYLSAPYQGDAPTHDYRAYWTIHANIARVQETALELARRGYGFFAPHVHSAHAEVIAPDIPAAYWYELDLHFLRACDAMLVLPGASKGVEKERAVAMEMRMPVYTSIETLIAEHPLRPE